ncbi:MAG: hypothetical protein OZSIB_1568 [Candidatus Ozemobacter sibiricus]|uniref:Lipoprotein n=1 Tax=Candidatus Ozemobacter sibiricus TaxID=2268124 RepID=A0A367ZJQ0_9BACT|nr:MAG: hypothetical protein OZSIB_1568 [Candidatus Ozemobacter sibiricus]
MRSFLLVSVLLVVVCFTVACEKSGELTYPAGPGTAVGPTISRLIAANTVLSRANGGILRLSCAWTTPWPISTATAYVAFVRSLLDGQASPTGVVGSGTASDVASITTGAPAPTDGQTQTATTTATASDTVADPAAFFLRFQSPLVIPLGIGTDQLTGFFQLDIPFPKADISDAPLGKQQMLLWMMINGRQTNSLAFEVEFVP